MEITLDRIEEGIAVFTDEQGQTHTLPAEKLPEGCSAGDVFAAEMSEDGLILRESLPKIRAERAERIRNKLEKLKQKRRK